MDDKEEGTMISIDQSMTILSKALDNLIGQEYANADKQEFILNLVDEYKSQLGRGYKQETRESLFNCIGHLTREAMNFSHLMDKLDLEENSELSDFKYFVDQSTDRMVLTCTGDNTRKVVRRLLKDKTYTKDLSKQS